MTWYVLAGLNLLGAFLFPYLINFLTPLNTFQGIIVGGIIFLSLNSVEQLERIKKLFEMRTREYQAWGEQDEIDALLSSIRTDYRNMRLQAGTGDSELVRKLISQRIEKLQDDVHVAAESKELYVDNNHAIDTSRVTDLFRNKKASQFFEVFNIADGSEIFGIYGGGYFKQIYELVASRHIEQAKVLIVVDCADEGALDKASKLRSFYKNAPYYDARVISKIDFDQIHLDTSLEHFEDFGLYGEILLFQTVGYDPVNRGKYSYDTVKVGKYRSFFDACWSLPERVSLPSVDSPLTVDEAVKL